jgi:hypothetical protein
VVGHRVPDRHGTLIERQELPTTAAASL